jgi:hypothetical protein
MYISSHVKVAESTFHFVGRKERKKPKSATAEKGKKGEEKSGTNP